MRNCCCWACWPWCCWWGAKLIVIWWGAPMLRWLRCPCGLAEGGGWWLCVCTWACECGAGGGGAIGPFCAWGERWCGPLAQWGIRQCIGPMPTTTPTAPPSLLMPKRDTILLRFRSTLAPSNHPRLYLSTIAFILPVNRATQWKHQKNFHQLYHWTQPPCLCLRCHAKIDSPQRPLAPEVPRTRPPTGRTRRLRGCPMARTTASVVCVCVLLHAIARSQSVAERSSARRAASSPHRDETTASSASRGVARAPDHRARTRAVR